MDVFVDTGTKICYNFYEFVICGLYLYKENGGLVPI